MVASIRHNTCAKICLICPGRVTVPSSAAKSVDWLLGADEFFCPVCQIGITPAEAQIVLTEYYIQMWERRKASGIEMSEGHCVATLGPLRGPFGELRKLIRGNKCGIRGFRWGRLEAMFEAMQ